ncbi:MAG: N-formylglutamate amidohydrolase [Roseobacter sp.]|jgi:predicted N-formylglutamate amidohydrolase
MNQSPGTNAHAVVDVLNDAGPAGIVLVCEHASCSIPDDLDNLGLDGPALTSHAACDIGAFGVAKTISAQLDAPLVFSKISRLVYDCNRPPEAPDAMPERSEAFDIPGNRHLTEHQKAGRISRYYRPFERQLEQTLADKPDPVLVTIHSFTPVYHGVRRDTEIGILHDDDRRLADAMLRCAGNHCDLETRRNEPYGPKDGVTHTLRRHALAQGRLNVMLEIRNDLIADRDGQTDLAAMMSGWITDALTRVEHAA